MYNNLVLMVILLALAIIFVPEIIMISTGLYMLIRGLRHHDTRVLKDGLVRVVTGICTIWIISHVGIVFCH